MIFWYHLHMISWYHLYVINYFSISDITIFKVTQGRISATYEGDKAKFDTFKLFGNGGMI